MKKHRVEFKVAVNLPDGMDIRDMREYILDAVDSWGGRYEPNVDPRFGMYKNNVVVSRISKKKKKKETPCQSQV